MSSAIATVVVVVGIAGLFHLTRDRKSRTSKALWIPIVWFLIAGSRPVSGWLEASPTPWAHLPTVSAEEYSESNPINSLTFFALLIAGVFVLAKRGPRIKRLLRANLPIICFFSYCALSTLWSDYPATAFRHWIRSFGDLVMVLVVMTEVDPLAALRRLLLRSGYLLLPISILLIKYYPYIGQVYGFLGDVMYTGVTQHKNTLGMVCMILGLGLLWCFSESYKAPNDRFRKRRLIAYGTCLAMVAGLLWIAKSATATSCFVMAGGLLAVVSMSAMGRRIKAVHALVVLLVSTSLFALFFDPSGNLVQTVGRNSTLTGRVAIWRYALGLAGNPLFGAGFESFWLGSRLQQMWVYLAGDRINQAHNGYLEVYLNLGWFGLIFLGAVLATGYRNIISTFRKDRHSTAFKLAYFTAAIMYNFTESAFRMGSMTWILLLMVVVRVPLVRETQVRECEPLVDDSNLVLSTVAQPLELV